jgi:3-oxoacyl-[acyl-carrier protein] reductase
MTRVIHSAREWTFSELAVGHTSEIERTFTADDLDRFADISGDFSPLHVDRDYARTTEFGDRVVHGMLLASLFSQLVGMWLPGKHALYLGQELSFRRPVFLGEAVKASAKITGKNKITRTLTLATEVRNSEGKVVVTGTAKVKMRDTAPVTQSFVDRSPSHSPAHERVALVVGGSRGIGAQIARTLSKRGAAVIVNYFRSADGAESVVRGITAANGEALALQADIRDAAAVQDMIERGTRQFGHIDWVVNCATGDLRQQDFLELEWTDFQNHFEYQVKGVMHIAQTVHPMMKSAGGGAMVNILSQVTSGVPPSRMADYVAAKYALYGLSKALAAEWAGDNIRVNMVSPGLVETDLTQHYPERAFKLEASRTPLKRIARPEDVAGAVAYLLSDDAAFVTGTNLCVTGGQVMI